MGERVNALVYGDGVIQAIELGSGNKPKYFTVHFADHDDIQYQYPEAFQKWVKKKCKDRIVELMR